MSYKVQMKSDKKNNGMPGILLNMIVKDEEHVIMETLKSISKFIDYYVISDTGSTDNTKKVIRDYFDSINIQGEIHDDKWENFGHNRTLALSHAKGKSKYIWIIDADDLVVGKPNINVDDMDADSYYLNIGKTFRYPRKNIVKNFIDYDWFYVGILHEYIDTNKPNSINKTIHGDYYIDSRRLGNRSKNPKKYEDDAEILEKEVIKNPNNERNVFYCAQSFYDCQNWAKAEKYYKMRTTMGGYREEIYYSLYKIAAISENTNRPWQETEQKFLNVFKQFSHRTEPLFKIASHYYNEKKWELAYFICDMGIKIQIPTTNALFVTTNVYTWKLLELYAISAFYTKRYSESYRAYEKIMGIINSENSIIPTNRIKQIKSDYNFIQPIKKTKTCLVYFGNKYIRTIDNVWGEDNIIALLSKYYNVSVCGSNIEDVPNLQHLNTTYVEENLINNNKFDLLVSIDCVNGIPDSNNFKTNCSTKIIYLNNTSSFDYYFDEGIVAHIFDDKEVTNILDKTDVVICKNKNIMSKLLNDYNMSNSLSVRLLDDVNSLDFSDFNTLPFLIEKYEKKNTFTFNTNSYDINFSFPNKISQNINDVQIKKIMDRIQNNKYLTSDILYEYGLLLNKKEKYNEACDVLKLALVHSKNRYSYKIVLHLCISYYYLEQYKTSFALASETLKRNKITLKDRNDIRNVRDWNISKVKDNFASYSSKIVKSIKQKSIKKQRMKVIVVMTTCKRLDLFKTTINSFLKCNLDLNLVDRWVCIDDNSSDADRIQMQHLYPFFDFVFKKENNKGHVETMNILRSVSSKYKYLIHLEDDFHFIEKRHYINDAIDIFEQKGNDNVKQVQFNKNYAEIEPYKQNIMGGHKLKTMSGQHYILHEHHKTIKPIKLRRGQYTNCTWPHYSFRPSVTKTDIFDTLGVFHKSKNFEREYSELYFDYGFKTAFFNSFCCIHTGKKTWEKKEIVSNAYSLNNVKQFDLDQNNFEIKVLSSKNLNNYVQFKSKFAYKTQFDRKKSIDLNNGHIHEINELYSKYGHNNKYYLKKHRLETIITLKNIINSYKNNTKDNWVLIICCDIYNNSIDISKVKKALDTIKNNCILANGCYLIKTNNYDNHYDEIIGNLFNCFSLIDNDDNDDNDNGINENDVDDFTFYDGVDSYGNDGKYYPNKSISELKIICKNDPNIIGFNSMGYTKKSICNDDKFILLPKYDYNSKCGLFVKNKSMVMNEKINKIINSKEKKLDITFTITTCKRLDKFIKTMDSLIMMCTDLHLIKKWIVIDDNSTIDDINSMKNKYSFLDIVHKNKKELKGHALSMNMILDKVNTKYVMHFEDDWECLEQFEIKNIIDMMNVDLCDQMILKKQYGKHLIRNDITRITIYDYKYNSLHKLLPNHYKQFHENEHVSINDSSENWWWPGFTLNPSIFNVRKIKDWGLTFDGQSNPGHFEYLFALELDKHNFRVCYIDNKIVHIGNDKSAYDLNEQYRKYE